MNHLKNAWNTSPKDVITLTLLEAFKGDVKTILTNLAMYTENEADIEELTVTKNSIS